MNPYLLVAVGGALGPWPFDGIRVGRQVGHRQLAGVATTAIASMIFV